MRPGRSAMALGSATAAGFASMWIVVPSDAAARAEVELHTVLRHGAAFPHARGHSEYERGSGHRELDVTVRVPGLAGRSVTVRVHGTFVGRIHVNGRGVAHREWDTEHGNRVPVVSAGDVLRVRAPSGRLVVSGRYHHDD